MNEILRNNLFLVKEQTGLFKASNNFDIFDAATGKQVMECREPNLGIITKALRFTDFKRYTPFNVFVKTMDGRQVVRVKRGVSIFLSKVQVFDDQDRLIGGFKQKLFTIGGKFDVLDANDKVVCTLKGKWSSWDFTFSAGDTVLAHVAKKWAGLGKELFTSADNYVLEIKNSVPPDHSSRQLILAAVMCIDMVLKE